MSYFCICQLLNWLQDFNYEWKQPQKPIYPHLLLNNQVILTELYLIDSSQHLFDTVEEL